MRYGALQDRIKCTFDRFWKIQQIYTDPSSVQHYKNIRIEILLHH